MDPDRFRQSLERDAPPAELTSGLRVLWLDANGDWDGAHDIAQAIATTDGSWLHAYLHRKEGDLPNADYWYRRAGRTRPDLSFDAEWNQLVEHVSATARAPGAESR